MIPGPLNIAAYFCHLLGLHIPANQSTEVSLPVRLEEVLVDDVVLLRELYYVVYHVKPLAVGVVKVQKEVFGLVHLMNQERLSFICVFLMMS